MGKGIIFVGSTNLNKNRDQQAMYSGSKSNLKNEAVKKKFYIELRNNSLKKPDIKKRKQIINVLKSKYGMSACSVVTMEKVFEAYTDCFQNCKTGAQIKNRKNQLPYYLDKYHVDKRIYIRLLKIEGIDTIDQVIENRKIKNVSSKRTKNQKRKLNKFYSDLHDYMDVSYNDETISLPETLRIGMRRYGKDNTFLIAVRNLYSFKHLSQLSIDEICKNEQIDLDHEDIAGLKKVWQSVYVDR